MKLPSVEPLDPQERTRLLEIAGLLARPALDARQAEQARTLLASPQWRPVPPIPALSGVEALMVHHAVELGFSAEHLFAPPPAVDFARLGINHLLRARERDRALDAMRAEGAGRAMLVKGAALAPFWPSPALREMEDIDLVVAPDRAAAAARALAGAGWHRHEFGWRHAASGCLLDLSVPRTDLARAIFERAQTHPLLGRDDVALPLPSDHLVLIAVHAARNRGLRLWRDLCDAATVLGIAPDAGAAALATAVQFGKQAETRALLRLLQITMWPESLNAPPVSVDDKRGQQLGDLYIHMRTDPISVFGLNALAGLSLSPAAMARAGWRSLRRAGTSSGSSAPGQLDPAFGAVPGAGDLSRQGIKLRWMWHLLKAGRLRHYVRLLRASDRAFDAGKVFDDAE